MVVQMLDAIDKAAASVRSFNANVVLAGGTTMFQGIGEHITNCWRQMSPLQWKFFSLLFIGHEDSESFTCQLGRE